MRLSFIFTFFIAFTSLSLLAQPAVDLGNDTTLCQGQTLTLDAGNAGSTFLWSTGETTQTVVVGTTGVYWVDVDDGVGVSRDSILVTVLDTVAFSVSDTTVCAGEVTLSVDGDTTAYYFWWDSAVGGERVYIGAELTEDLMQDTTFYIEGRVWDSNTMYSGGYEPIGNSNNGGYYAIATNPIRGMVFDVTEPIMLDSIDLYSTGNLVGVLEIKDPSNTILLTKTINTGNSGRTTIPIGLTLSLGNGYQIVFEKQSGTSSLLHVDFPVSFPLNYGELIFQSSFPVSGHYNYFYNWQYRKLGCPTIRKELNVTVPPIFDLGPDTLLCGTDLFLDISNIGADSYSWSTGDSTGAILVTQSSLITASAQNGNCVYTDSIDVVILDTVAFSVSDTTVCAGEVTLSVDGDSSGVYLWWDAAVGGQILGSGPTHLNSFMEDTILYIESYNEIGVYGNSFPLDSIDPLGSGVFYFFTLTQTRGLVINVDEKILLESVKTYWDAYQTANVILKDLSGTVVYDNFVELESGENKVELNWLIEPGTYEILLSNRTTNAKGYVVAFVNNFPLINAGPLSIVEGYVNPTTYDFFYSFEYKELSCNSSRKALNLTSLPAPISTLPIDTLVCADSFLLDLTSIVADSILWSNGDTSNQLVVYQSELLSFQASLGSCTTTDSIQINLYSPPVVQVNDTTVCAGNIALSVSQDSLSGSYLWWDSPTGGDIVFNGVIYDLFLDTSISYYIEKYDVLDIESNLYPQSLIDGFGNGFYYQPPLTQTRGLVIRVNKEILLESFKLYWDAPQAADVRLRNLGGGVIYSKNVSFNPGENEVNVNWMIPDGVYELVLENRTTSAGGYVVANVANFPLSGNVLEILQGYVNPVTYDLFCDFTYIELACRSPRQQMNVIVNPAPLFLFPGDSVICGDSLLLDMSILNADSYSWTTGSTDPSVTISQSDTIALTANIGSCFVSDTMNVLFTNPPSFASVLSDTTICPGDITIFAQSDGYTQAWYDAEFAQSPINFGDSINLNLSDTATYWVEGINFLMRTEYYAEVQQPYFPGGAFEDIANSNYASRGLNFDVFEPIILNELSVFADTSISGTISLVDQYGYTVYSQNISLVAGENILNLDWFIEPANNYRLTLTNLTDGGIYLITNYSFPIEYDEFIIRAGYPVTQSNDYNYFFKWRISTLGCATARQSVTINVLEEPELSLPADTVFCNAATGISLFATGANNPNYTYEWNTGENTDSIFVNNSGLYEVTVTANGLCSKSSNVNVQFLTPPAPYQANDTSICYSSEVSLLSPPNEGLLVWSRLPNSGLTVHLGAPYTTYIPDTTTYELAMAARATTRLGDLTHPNPSDLGQYQSFIISNTFDVNEAVILDSVAVYMKQAPASFDIVLKNGSNQELERRTFTINQAQTKVFVPLDWVILPSNQYRLEFDNISSDFLVNQNTIYPQTSPVGAVELTGTNFAGVSYNCFYDWHFSYALAGCSAATIDSFTVDVKLPLYLQDYVYACDTAVLNASNGAATYLWNTGETTDSIVVYAPGVYTVSMTDGASCSIVDSITVGGPIPVGLPTNNSICGIILTTNYDTTTATDFLWSTGDTTSSLTIPSTGIYAVTITTNDGCVISDTSFINQIENPPAVNIGTFLTFCGPDTLDAGFGGFGMSYLWSTGDTTQTIMVDTIGSYSVTVTTPNGCAGSDDTFVDMDSPPVSNFNYTISGSSVALVNLSQNADNYYWDFGDGSATTFVQPFHTYPANDCYDVMLVSYNDCGTDTLIQTIVVGVSPLQCDTTNSTVSLNGDELEISIFPNPNNGQFVLDFNQAIEDVQMLEVYNAQGQRVWEENIQAASTTVLNLNLVDLPAGVYYLSCVTSKNRYMQTFVVKRY